MRASDFLGGLGFCLVLPLLVSSTPTRGNPATASKVRVLYPRMPVPTMDPNNPPPGGWDPNAPLQNKKDVSRKLIEDKPASLEGKQATAWQKMPDKKAGEVANKQGGYTLEQTKAGQHFNKENEQSVVHGASPAAKKDFDKTTSSVFGEKMAEEAKANKAPAKVIADPSKYDQQVKSSHFGSHELPHLQGNGDPKKAVPGGVVGVDPNVNNGAGTKPHYQAWKNPTTGEPSGLKPASQYANEKKPSLPKLSIPSSPSTKTSSPVTPKAPTTEKFPSSIPTKSPSTSTSTLSKLKTKLRRRALAEAVINRLVLYRRAMLLSEVM